MKKASLVLIIIFLMTGFFSFSRVLDDQAPGQEYREDSEKNGINKYVKKIDSSLKELYTAHEFNGCILIGKKGEILYKKCQGIADYRTEEKLQSNSQFKLASVSKQFTAMAIMILKERGKVAYDDDIRKYIPEMPYEGITIRHLLTHVSGLPDHEHYWMRGEWPENKEIPTNSDLIQWFDQYKKPLLFETGTQYKYCNTGYAVLACIVERVTKTEFAQFVMDNIFDPLEMTGSLVFLPYKEHKLKNRAYGYVKTESQQFRLFDSTKMDGVVGHDGVYSTIEDLLKWDQALYTDKLVSKSTLEEAFTPGKLNNGEEIRYGFGWALSGDGDKKYVSHGGSWVGFKTYILREINDRIVVIVLTNNTDKNFGKLVKVVYQGIETFEIPLPNLEYYLRNL